MFLLQMAYAVFIIILEGQAKVFNFFEQSESNGSIKTFVSFHAHSLTLQNFTISWKSD